MLAHKKIEENLARSIVSGKVFPTWIFSGPSGVGKSTMAYRFAKCLLSQTLPADSTLHVDENNKVHRLVEQMTHPDFFVLNQMAASIDDVRELLQKIRMTPVLSKWRVAILKGADTFNKNIYNSLLKFLEEPPRNTVIILIANNTGGIPKTLLSRASKIYFHPLGHECVETFLQQQNIEQAHELARISDGSIGYAMCLNSNNGLEIYDTLLHGFISEENSKISLKYALDNNLKDVFQIVTTSFIRILKVYIDLLNKVNIDSCDKELKVFHAFLQCDPDAETKLALDIIAMLNKSDLQQLDRNAVLACVYEKFFSNKR